MNATKLLNAATFNWKTNLVGIAGVVLGVIQGLSNDTTLSQLFHDGRFGMLLLVALLGFVSKDGDAHGTPSAPISVPAAAKIAEVAATTPTPRSYVGAAIPNWPKMFAALPGDPTEFGGLDPTGKYTKRMGVYEQTTV